MAQLVVAKRLYEVVHGACGEAPDDLFPVAVGTEDCAGDNKHALWVEIFWFPEIASNGGECCIRRAR